MKKYKVKAVRVPAFDCVGDENYGETPYAVVHDIYDLDGNYVEQGTSWKYFESESSAESYCLTYNSDVDREKFLNWYFGGSDQEKQQSLISIGETVMSSLMMVGAYEISVQDLVEESDLQMYKEDTDGI